MFKRVINHDNLKWLLLVIPFGYVFFLLFFSLFSFFKLSVYDDTGFTLEYITHIYKNPVYLHVLYITFKVAFLVTIFTLLLSYPVAYLLVTVKSSFYKKVIFSAIIIPFLISLLVRTYAWSILLQDSGVINKILMFTGLINEPLSLLFNTTGVVIAMTHILLPYMVLNLYASMDGIDQQLILAAQNLGARPIASFFQIFFPLSIRGVLSGSMLVFVLALGYFVTPALLGGNKSTVISMLIETSLNKTLNWHLAASLSLLLFTVTFLLLTISFLILRNNPLLGEED